jgi:uncharacterized protein YkwD
MTASPRSRSIAPRPLVAVALCAAAVAASTGPAGASQAAGGEGGGCPHAGEPAGRVSIGGLRKAILCLVNEERRRHGRAGIGRNRALQQVANRHTEVMIRTGCMAHRCPGEAPLATRVRRSGYTAGARKWRFAENTGCARTAKAMIANWMGTTFHRINLLRPGFRDIGVGPSHRRVAKRCPRGYDTFTAILAFRKG